MTLPPLRLTESARAALVAHAAGAAPREACGFLLGPAGEDACADTAVPSANLAPPGVVDAFELDTALHLRLQREARAAGRRIVGVYHSHPASPPLPSRRDRDGAYDHGLVWLIVGPEGVCRAWWPGPDGFREACIEVVP